MSCRILRSAALVLSLLSIPLFGCETKTLQIQLSGFSTSGIEGIYLYRRNDQGQFERMCRIDIDGNRLTAGGETVQYIQNCVDGKEIPAILHETLVRRSPSAPDTILIDIWYMRYEDPGLYRATAFNAAGESALSATELTL